MKSLWFGLACSIISGIACALNGNWHAAMAWLCCSIWVLAMFVKEAHIKYLKQLIVELTPPGVLLDWAVDEKPLAQKKDAK